MRRTLRIFSLVGAVALLVAGGAKAGAEENVTAEKAAAVAQAARLAGDESRTRFVVDLDRQVDFHVFTLAEPYRVVIDLPQSEFRFEEGAGEQGRGLVQAYRFGRFAPGKSRIVLDAVGPVKVDRAFSLEPQDGQPARLVVDLVDTSHDQMLTEIADAGAAEPPQSRSEPQLEGHVAVPPGGGRRADAIVIVLDPGHGGIDPGAASNSGVKEKEVVLDFALRLNDALEATGRFEVHMTREDDVFVSLTDRVRFAREKRASLFISIHADTVARGSASGASVYTLSERASDEVAAQLAAQENRSDALAGIDLNEGPDDVADILLDLVHRETKSHSVFFARTLVENLRDDIALVRNPMRSGGFRVLEAHDVPSVLIELGYLNNKDDEKLLTDEEWQDTMAARITDAVKVYFGEKQARAPF